MTDRAIRPKKENGLQIAILMKQQYDFFKSKYSIYAFEQNILFSIFHWKKFPWTDPPAYIPPTFWPIQEAKIL